MMANIPELNTRARSGTPTPWKGPMIIPTMPAPAGPTREMAARMTMPVNDRLTRLPTRDTEPSHQARTVEEQHHPERRIEHEAVETIVAAVRRTPSAATMPT